MAKITFLGAAGIVTGSSYLYTADNGSQILIDLGMFQESSNVEELNQEPLPFDASKLQAVFLTHAHLDHCGRLPLLIKAGYKGRIYITEPTKMIAHISLIDAANIAKEEKKVHPVIFTKDEVEQTFNTMLPVEYDKQFPVGDFLIAFRNAGHILGSASVEIAEKGSPENITVFSGDLGNTPQDLEKPTEYIQQATTVVMESTYGSTVHPQEDIKETLQKEIAAIELSKGILLIPAFSIERTQEILHIFRDMKRDKKIPDSLPVFLDSPMAIRVTEVFKQYPTYYNEELSHDEEAFNFPGLTSTQDTKESKDIINKANPKVIIASSGMLSGGRILHHLANYISLPTTRILFVGYQAVGTLGRDLVDGAREIDLYDRRLPVQATITKSESLSSHADQPKLIKWLQQIKGVKKVFLIHGENEQRNALAEKIKTELHIEDVVLPKKDETIETMSS